MRATESPPEEGADHSLVLAATRTGNMWLRGDISFFLKCTEACLEKFSFLRLAPSITVGKLINVWNSFPAGLPVTPSNM